MTNCGQSYYGVFRHSCVGRSLEIWYNLSMKQAVVYILASAKNGTLYIGVTSDLPKRIYEHKNHIVDGFTKRYNINILVWYELHENMIEAIAKEKQLKKWKRDWKLRIIEESNPNWNDLYNEII